MLVEPSIRDEGIDGSQFFQQFYGLGRLEGHGIDVPRWRHKSCATTFDLLPGKAVRLNLDFIAISLSIWKDYIKYS